MFRAVDPVKGEIDRPIAMVPAVTVTVDQPIEYVPANRPFERAVMVSLHSASNHARTVRACTMHSFCLQLAREHFHELGLDPQFGVLDEQQSRDRASGSARLSR